MTSVRISIRSQKLLPMKSSETTTMSISLPSLPLPAAWEPYRMILSGAIVHRKDAKDTKTRKESSLKGTTFVTLAFFAPLWFIK